MSTEAGPRVDQFSLLLVLPLSLWVAKLFLAQDRCAASQQIREAFDVAAHASADLHVHKTLHELYMPMNRGQHVDNSVYGV